MRWEEVFAVLLACHVTGDFLLQTDWQATNKRGGLGRDRESRRALIAHVVVYTLCFVPAVVWIASETSALAYGLLAVVFIPHLIQDDGRVLLTWHRIVKRSKTKPDDVLYMAIDQAFHFVTLFGTALLAAV